MEACLEGGGRVSEVVGLTVRPHTIIVIHHYYYDYYMGPAVGVVEEGEKQHPAAEEGEQQGGAVQSVQQRVLLLELRDKDGAAAPPSGH